MPIKSGLTVKKPGKDWDQILADLRMMVGIEVLVGFPDDTADRKEPGDPMTNAALGYIHDHGAPEAHIPARPFMIPGMNNAKPQAEKELVKLAEAVSKGKKGPKGRNIVEVGFTRLGLVVQRALRAKINEGIPPPLAERTLAERAARGRKGAKQELENRAKGMTPSTALAKPLIDTGQLRNAINYVIRSRRKRR
jgi:hypothetical protein